MKFWHHIMTWWQDRFGIMDQTWSNIEDYFNLIYIMRYERWIYYISESETLSSFCQLKDAEFILILSIFKFSCNFYEIVVLVETEILGRDEGREKPSHHLRTNMLEVISISTSQTTTFQFIIKYPRILLFLCIWL